MNISNAPQVSMVSVEGEVLGERVVSLRRIADDARRLFKVVAESLSISGPNEDSPVLVDMLGELSSKVHDLESRIGGTVVVEALSAPLKSEEGNVDVPLFEESTFVGWREVHPVNSTQTYPQAEASGQAVALDLGQQPTLNTEEGVAPVFEDIVHGEASEASMGTSADMTRSEIQSYVRQLFPVSALDSIERALWIVDLFYGSDVPLAQKNIFPLFKKQGLASTTNEHSLKVALAVIIRKLEAAGVIEKVNKSNRLSAYIMCAKTSSRYSEAPEAQMSDEETLPDAARVPDDGAFSSEPEVGVDLASKSVAAQEDVDTVAIEPGSESPENVNEEIPEPATETGIVAGSEEENDAYLERAMAYFDSLVRPCPPMTRWMFETIVRRGVVSRDELYSEADKAFRPDTILPINFRPKLVAALGVLKVKDLIDYDYTGEQPRIIVHKTAGYAEAVAVAEKATSTTLEEFIVHIIGSNDKLTLKRICEAVEVSGDFGVDMDTIVYKTLKNLNSWGIVFGDLTPQKEREYTLNPAKNVEVFDKVTEFSGQAREDKIADIIITSSKYFESKGVVNVDPMLFVLAGLVDFSDLKVSRDDPKFEPSVFVRDYRSKLASLSPAQAGILVYLTRDHNLLTLFGVGYRMKHKALRERAGQAA